MFGIASHCRVNVALVAAISGRPLPEAVPNLPEIRTVGAETSAPTVVSKARPFFERVARDPLAPGYFASATISGADVSVEPLPPVPTSE